MKILLTSICISLIGISACADSILETDAHFTIVKTQSKKMANGQFSKLKYHYFDASIPSQHHRSYSITVDKAGDGKYICTSYDDTLINKTFIISNEELLALQQAISEIKGVKKLKFKSVNGTTAEGLDIFDLENKQAVDAYWNLPASASIRSFVKLLKSITTMQVGELGIAEYQSPLDKYIKTKGDYVNLSFYSDFNQITDKILLAIQDYLADEKVNIFKQSLSLKEYYALDKLSPEKDGVIEIILIHKDDFKLRYARKDENETLDIGNNPTGYNGTIFYNLNSESISGMNAWE